jgi:medium-chain acyl-[acyl-carrier-protein] hydrolase
VTRSPVQSPWLVMPKPSPNAGVRLFCFPYAGGGASIYRRWPESFPPNVEVCPVQLPGRENRLRESPYTSIAPLVRDIAQALGPYFDRPFAFFGHSMGALISFELTRLLRREGRPLPVRLFLSGRHAPHLIGRDSVTYNLPEDELIEELKCLQGTPAEVLEHPELMRLILPLLRADFEVCQTHEYEPEPPLECPITIFGGLQDQEVPREDLEVWSQHTAHGSTLRMLPGDHFFINSSRQLLCLAVARDLQQRAQVSI